MKETLRTVAPLILIFMVLSYILFRLIRWDVVGQDLLEVVRAIGKAWRGEP